MAGILTSKSYKRICHSCKEDFTADRKDQKYCGNPCKTSAYRKRQSKKMESLEQGGEIAQQEIQEKDKHLNDIMLSVMEQDAALLEFGKQASPDQLKNISQQMRNKLDADSYSSMIKTLSECLGIQVPIIYNANPADDGKESLREKARKRIEYLTNNKEAIAKSDKEFVAKQGIAPAPEELKEGGSVASKKKASVKKTTPKMKDLQSKKQPVIKPIKQPSSVELTPEGEAAKARLFKLMEKRKRKDIKDAKSTNNGSIAKEERDAIAYGYESETKTRLKQIEKKHAKQIK